VSVSGGGNGAGGTVAAQEAKRGPRQILRECDRWRQRRKGTLHKKRGCAAARAEHKKQGARAEAETEGV
jgi:hypothetical protein